MRLHGPPGPWTAGRTIPVAVEVRNESAREVWLVGVVDGSEDAVRYPHWRPAVTREGALEAAPPPPEDPLVGPLRAADFRRLGPGESFDPTRPEGGAAYLPLSTFATFVPSQAGSYRFMLELSTESPRPEAWLGRFGQDAERERVLELVGRVPRLTVASNVLEVTVR